MESLGISVGIGIYQGCFRSKQLTTNEFLIADGRMKVITFHREREIESFVFDRFYRQQ